MDFGTISIQAALVSAIIVLARIIERLLDKRRIEKNGRNCGAPCVFAATAASKLAELQKEHKDHTQKLTELHKMHSVVDDNGVPRWYFPADMQRGLDSFHTEYTIGMSTVRTDINTIKADQTAINNRITELITSQHRMVDRIGDLITKLDQLIARGN